MCEGCGEFEDMGFGSGFSRPVMIVGDDSMCGPITRLITNGCH